MPFGASDGIFQNNHSFYTMGQSVEKEMNDYMSIYYEPSYIDLNRIV